MANTNAAIVATKVQESAKMACLPRHFGPYVLSVEHGTYNHLNRLCEEYKGGTWDFFELSNGGFYMAPQANKRYRISEEGNQFSAEMSADAAGIVATLWALNDLMCRLEEDWAIEKYHALRDFALVHPDARLIMAAID